MEGHWPGPTPHLARDPPRPRDHRGEGTAPADSQNRHSLPSCPSDQPAPSPPTSRMRTPHGGAGSQHSNPLRCHRPRLTATRWNRVSAQRPVTTTQTEALPAVCPACTLRLSLLSPKTVGGGGRGTGPTRVESTPKKRPAGCPPSRCGQAHPHLAVRAGWQKPRHGCDAHQCPPQTQTCGRSLQAGATRSFIAFSTSTTNCFPSPAIML